MPGQPGQGPVSVLASTPIRTLATPSPQAGRPPVRSLGRYDVVVGTPLWRVVIVMTSAVGRWNDHDGMSARTKPGSQSDSDQCAKNSINDQRGWLGVNAARTRATTCSTSSGSTRRRASRTQARRTRSNGGTRCITWHCAEAAEPHLVRAEHQDWFRRLDVDRGNLRRGMAWTIDHGETVLALRYSVALWRYWRQLGEFAEGRRWSDATLAVAGNAAPSLRAKALCGAAALAFPQADHARMAELAAEAITLAHQSDDPMDLRNALTVLGLVAMCQGRYTDALEPYTECVAICRRLGISWQLATSHLNLGDALLALRSMPRRRSAALHEALRLYRELGDDIFAARVLNHIAHAALAENDLDRADHLGREALASVAEQAERQGIAECLETLAAVGAARLEMERAATLAGAAASIREAIASRPAPFDVAITGRLLDRTKSTMTEKRWRRTWEKGRALDSVAAVAYALENQADTA